MNLKTVRVRQRELTCNTCDTEFIGYSEADHEDAVLLYECDECGAIFSLSNDDMRPLEDIVNDRHCPDCDAPLAETLGEKTHAGICPMCEDRDYRGSGASEEVDLETYEL